jgi:hypothetical protein
MESGATSRLLHTWRDIEVGSEGALRASRGRALQIFPEPMTDNILVIDGRRRFFAEFPPACRRGATYSRKKCGVARLMRATQ